jgi:hypothetical protein
MFYDEKESAVEGARCLGWGSIGIGLTELAAPDRVASMLGIEDSEAHRGVIRALGAREFMHGVGILTERRPTPQLAAGIWSRVLGDVLDTALLGVAAMKTRRPGSFAAVAAVVSAIGVMDMLYAVRVSRHVESYA